MKTDLTIGKTILSLLVILFVLTGPFCHAQTPVRVSDPRIEMEGNTIHIYYDILESKASDKFNIHVEITDENGNRINARALDGDIGEDIPSGNNKHITWDLDVDKIYLNARVFFEINATLVPGPETAAVRQEEQAPVSVEIKEFDRTGLILQSIAIPGLGLSKVTGKPHWIKGVAGYVCIAGSVIFNLQARLTYDSIEDYPDFEDKRELFDTSVAQDNLSDVLGFAAIGIWVGDFIWTLTGTSHLKKSSLAGNAGGISVGGSLDPLTYTPTIKIRYRF